MTNEFCIGLDLGQSNDYTALAIVQVVQEDEATGGRSRRGRTTRAPADSGGQELP